MNKKLMSRMTVAVGLTVCVTAVGETTRETVS